MRRPRVRDYGSVHLRVDNRLHRAWQGLFSNHVRQHVRQHRLRQHIFRCICNRL